MKTVYFVRHGEAEGNVSHTFQTHHTPLTDQGHIQASLVAARCAKLNAQALLVSPMLRTQQTAAPIAEATSLQIETLESLHEVLHASSMAGKSRMDENGQAYLQNLEQILLDGGRFEDAENFEDVLLRLKTTMEVLENRPEERIIVVTHGRFMKSLMTYILHEKHSTPLFDRNFARTLRYMDNTGITVVEEYEPKTWRLDTWNDHAHFAET